ncbi:hypothetical protein H2198_003110 [Neophaeococcomyces mojaviensis]|uniref:Uncharacterized protein n=1 Tax=Neophaeococcomyces mojaviensis TaxID=3383035 RepID=A0ACC3AC49_9EURO|nr:hypothetical protein H2198_003110 [Knufia sp. JES_112]
MSGPFIPADFEPQVNSPEDIKIAAIAWGFTLGFGYLTCSKALKQSHAVWERSHRISTYVALVWIEVLSSLTYGILAWLLMDNVMPINFYALFAIVVAWSLQIQCLLQIIINRVSLLIIDKSRAAYIKWGVALIITLVNLSVFIIWIPARLQISEKLIRINAIWDPIEKVIYLLIDGCLNVYFLYLVHSNLVSAGMTKYRRLFKFNAYIVVISLSMDILIISMMNLKNSFVYTQFHSLAYIVKLNIELTMASLITKIVAQPGGIYGNSGRLTQSDMTEAGHTNRTMSHPHTQSRTDEFVASTHNERGQQPTYKAWVDGPQAQAGSCPPQKKKKKRRTGLNDIEGLSDSDESFQSEALPENNSNGDGVTGKTMEIKATTECIELCEMQTPSMNESTRNLNQDFGGGTRT